MWETKSNKTCQGYTRKRILKLVGYSIFWGRKMKRPFNKPATTYTQQVALLQKRGMRIGDVAKAELCLQHVNYYRLSAYWLPFQINPKTHEFKSGTRFDEVLSFYTFDRELRLLILDSIVLNA